MAITKTNNMLDIINKNPLESDKIQLNSSRLKPKSVLNSPENLSKNVLNSELNVSLKDEAHMDDGKKLNIDKITKLCREQKVGIVPEHLMELQILAQKKNCVISIRPVDLMATDLIRDGHPTKGFKIKGKSANWGPQTAFICVNQALSKLADQPQKTLNKFNTAVQECLDQKNAKEVDLKITKNRIELLEKEGIVYEVEKNDSGAITKLKAKTSENVEHEFTLNPCDEGSELYLVNYNGAPVKVLSSVGNNEKPLTADYDILMIAPSIEDFGSKDNLAVPDVARTIVDRRMEIYNNKKTNKTETSSLEKYLDSTNPIKIKKRHPDKIKETVNSTINKLFSKLKPDFNSFNAREDKDIGNATPRISDMIDEINMCLVGERGEKVVHHSSDTGNPVTDPAANFPATFALPKSMGRFDKICVIKDQNEFKDMVQLLKDEGYHVPLNPLWEEDVTNIRASYFSSAKKAFLSH
ncbi:CyaA/EF/ExoY family adenylyl cyclase toxin [Candidatus Williamhamiltonella defendens]|uniref:Adenylate cyclase n=1 Tax=Candidatus Hamiltonella defensa (Bemisia tabaci) TaxID=672795 RepID=A0A249DYI5_9ENTR|nr:CyaA/EF/ExoY family adenylyl cyclase toxin [Candidatus Hamiltonella defensa]ASX25967.1 adenylate cyclase [Candidatus Hamiltonella defensa (Bemisia tabaci)]